MLTPTHASNGLGFQAMRHSALGINQVRFDGSMRDPEAMRTWRQARRLADPNPGSSCDGSSKASRLQTLWLHVCKLHLAMWGGWPRLRSMIDSAATPASLLAGHCG
jgi:hypothetical protein